MATRPKMPSMKAFSVHKLESVDRRDLPPIKESKQMQKMHAKELSYNISKFEQMMVDEVKEEAVIRCAIQILKNFSEVENNFTSLFVDLHRTLRAYVYMIDDPLADKHFLKAGVSYRLACQLVDRAQQNTIDVKNALIKTAYDQIDSLKAQIKQQTEKNIQERTVLLAELKRYKELADPHYVLSLQRRIEDLKEALSNQQISYKRLARQNEQADQTIQQLQHNSEEALAFIAKLKTNVHDLNVGKEKTEIYLLNMKDRFDELMSKMIGLKEIITKVELENETLTTERMKLVNRAAVAFDDLTPRPKYPELFRVKQGQRVNATVDIVRGLVSRLEQSQKNKICESVVIAPKNRRLQDCEQIRANVVKDIYAAKEGVHSLLRQRQPI